MNQQEAIDLLLKWEKEHRGIIHSGWLKGGVSGYCDLTEEDIYSDFRYKVLKQIRDGKFRKFGEFKALKYFKAAAKKSVLWYAGMYTRHERRQTHKEFVRERRLRLMECWNDFDHTDLGIIKEISDRVKKGGGFTYKVWQTYLEITMDYFNDMIAKYRDWNDCYTIDSRFKQLNWRHVGLGKAVAEKLGVSRQRVHMYKKKIDEIYKRVVNE